jgi:hypothetical protein
LVSPVILRVVRSSGKQFSFQNYSSFGNVTCLKFKFLAGFCSPEDEMIKFTIKHIHFVGAHECICYIPFIKAEIFLRQYFPLENMGTLFQ